MKGKGDELIALEVSLERVRVRYVAGVGIMCINNPLTGRALAINDMIQTFTHKIQEKYCAGFVPLRTKNLDKTWPVSCVNIKWGGRYSLFYPVTNFRSSSAGSSRHERQIHSRVETRLDQGVMIPAGASVTLTPDVIMTKMINLDPIILRRFVILCDSSSPVTPQG